MIWLLSPEITLKDKADYSATYTGLNKVGYTAIQSRTVGQEQWYKNRSEFKNVTDGRTYRHTDQPTRQGVELRVCN